MFSSSLKKIPKHALLLHCRWKFYTKRWAVLLFCKVFTLFYVVKIVYICLFMTCSTSNCLCDTHSGRMDCVCVCVYLSVHMKHFGSQWTDFREIRNSKLTISNDCFPTQHNQLIFVKECTVLDLTLPHLRRVRSKSSWMLYNIDFFNSFWSFWGSCCLRLRI